MFGLHGQCHTSPELEVKSLTSPSSELEGACALPTVQPGHVSAGSNMGAKQGSPAISFSLGTSPLEWVAMSGWLSSVWPNTSYQGALHWVLSPKAS